MRHRFLYTPGSWCHVSRTLSYFNKKRCSVILPAVPSALPHTQEIGFADTIHQDGTRYPINRTKVNSESRFCKTFLFTFEVFKSNIAIMAYAFIILSQYCTKKKIIIDHRKCHPKQWCSEAAIIFTLWKKQSCTRTCLLGEPEKFISVFVYAESNY